MPTDPTDPSTRKPSSRLDQTSTDEPKGGGGGIIFIVLLLLLLGGGVAYYFLMYKPAADAGAKAVAAAATPTPAKSAPKAVPSASPVDHNAERAEYVKQAEQAYTAQRDAKVGPFNDAFAAFKAAGGLGAAGLTSKEAIATRRDLIAKCQTTNDEYETFTKTQDAVYKAELKKTKLSAEDVEYVSNDFSFKAQTEKSLKQRELRRESLKTADAMLAYLEKTYGNWSISAAQRITFKKPADADAYSALGKTYNEQVAAIEKIQAEIKAIVDPTSPDSSPSASPLASVPAVSPVPAAASPAPTAVH